ncbi:MFS transporter [Variovorax arabinosiphilus]|uniref:MFS transporter n=1 Tax=Variovorax arabinosiphilus TaxID=3053498 RepID=UPI0025773070|nr:MULTISPECIES: MFS transporter [unclassified Variovorax]MDM0120794.1 MFS transporter [Variovorax sp. J2L1-78]MDM0127294.1 MFS transporter [Variovorax sp. J2L1-63]MDM0236174.1 MFS transporter [Variovorax sp. J2R1-6]
MSAEGRRLVLLLSLSYAVSFVDRALVAVAGAPIKQAFALSDTQFGLLHGLAFVAMYCLCGIPFGWLADRADRRRILAGGLLFWSVMTAVCGLADSFALFFVARIGVGLGEACLVPVAMSMLGSAIPREHMARSVTVFLMGATLGNAAALIGGGRLLAWMADSTAWEAWGAAWVDAPDAWRVLFVVAAVPGVLLAVLALCMAEPPRTAGTPQPTAGGGLAAAARHLRSHASAYFFLTAATACSVTLAQAQAAWMPMFFSRRFGFGSGESAMMVGFIFLATAPSGQWVGGRVLTHLQRRGAPAPSNLLLAAAALLCLPAAAVFCLADDPDTSRAAYAAFNFLVFSATPAGLTGWQLLTPDRVRGVLIALLVSVVTLVGVGIGPGAVGLLIDRGFGDPQAIHLALLSVIALAALACAVTALAGLRSVAQSSRTQG